MLRITNNSQINQEILRQAQDELTFVGRIVQFFATLPENLRRLAVKIGIIYDVFNHDYNAYTTKFNSAKTAIELNHLLDKIVQYKRDNTLLDAEQIVKIDQLIQNILYYKFTLECDKYGELLPDGTVQVPDDGNCFYSSMAYLLKPDEASQSSEIDSSSLRKKVIDSFRNHHKNGFKDDGCLLTLILNDIKAHNDAYREHNFSPDDPSYGHLAVIKDGDIEAYITQYSNPRAWATTSHIYELSRILKKPIKIISNFGEQNQYEILFNLAESKEKPLEIAHKKQTHFDPVLVSKSLIK